MVLRIISVKRQTPITICLFLIISILAVYWQVRNNDFINYDDTAYVTKNENVKAGITREGVIWAFTTRHDGSWFPLTWLSHMLDCELYGVNPAGHHWTSLLIHIANTILLFIVIHRMTGAVWRSAFVAALFGLHPLHVESVAWVAERKDVLSSFFGLLTLLAYHRYVRDIRRINYLPVVLFFCMGLMAKPMLVTLPFVLLLLDFWPLARLGFTNTDHRISDKQVAGVLVFEKIPLFAISAAWCVLALSFEQRGGSVASLEHFPVKVRIANALVSYIKYLGKMIWPQHLAVFYPHTGTVGTGHVLLSVIMLIFVSFMVIRAARRFPYLVTGWFWFLGTLVPVIGLVQIGSQSMADRYTYIPLVGLFIVASWGIYDVTAQWRSQRMVLTVLSAAVLCPLMICTWFQVGHWRNSITLFTHTLDVTTGNWMAHTRLGHALDQAGKTEKAMFHYSEALRIYPNYSTAHINLGALFVQKGDNKSAVDHYNAALRINPKDAGIYNNLGIIYSREGRIEAAILHYREALRLNPNMLQALYNLARIAATHSNEKYRNGKEAVELAEKLCKLTHYNHPLFMDTLAEAYAEAGRFEAAVITVQKVRQLALTNGLEKMAAGAEMKMKLYEAGRPYREVTNGENGS